MKMKILTDFQICISVPLMNNNKSYRKMLSSKMLKPKPCSTPEASSRKHTVFVVNTD